MTDTEPKSVGPPPPKKYYGVFAADGAPKGFYVDDIYPPDEDGERHAAIHADAIEISEAEWQALLTDQARARYVGGKVVYVELPPPPEPEASPVEMVLAKMDEIMRRLTALEKKGR